MMRALAGAHLGLVTCFDLALKLPFFQLSWPTPPSGMLVPILCDHSKAPT